MTIIPTIICGGAGSRLWPLSRETYPKPFINLIGDNTLIGATYKRASNLPDIKFIITVTNRDLLFLTSDAYAETGINGIANTFLLEPFGRDTAAAIALAAIHVQQTHGPETCLLVLPADHVIKDESAFATAVTRAEMLALEGQIVTFGIIPERPETGYGYIETSHERVVRFVEKPDLDRAREYVSSGKFLWNSGMFCFTAKTMLKAMERYCPAIVDGARRAYNASQPLVSGARTALEIDRTEFATTPASSIDYAVMERASNVACVAVDCGWSDIGSWDAVADFISADEAGNRLTGEIYTEGAQNCFVHSQDRLVGLVGVDDLLVIDSPDALLIARRDKAQDVKRLYAHLNSQGHPAARLHRTMHRPWGTYTVLEEGKRFKIKRIKVKPGGSLSLQAHHHRSEHWVVVCGTAKVSTGDTEIILTTNQSTYIPCGTKHRLENPGIMPLIVIEVQSGDYLGEDDIVRFEDIYGRVQ